MHSWQRRTLGILALGGSAIGCAAVGTLMFSDITWPSRFLMGAFLALYCWGIWCGVKILEGSPSALRNGMWFWVMQIPVIQSSFLSYMFSSGALAGLWLQPTELKINFLFWLGSRVEASFMQDKPLGLGINVFALVVVVWLWRLLRVQPFNNSFKPKPLRGSA